jgi:PAS domain S-box-containing protein
MLIPNLKELIDTTQAETLITELSLKCSIPASLLDSSGKIIAFVGNEEYEREFKDNEGISIEDVFLKISDCLTGEYEPKIVSFGSNIYCFVAPLVIKSEIAGRLTLGPFSSASLIKLNPFNIELKTDKNPISKKNVIKHIEKATLDSMLAEAKLLTETLSKGEHQLQTIQNVIKLSLKNKQPVDINDDKGFKTFADFLPIIAYEADINGKILYTNNAGLAKFGYSKEDLDNLSWFDLVHPNDRQRCIDNSYKLLNGEDIHNIEYLLIPKDGIAFHGLVNSYIVVNEFDEKFFRGIVIDISEVKDKENQLKTSEEHFRNLFESASDAIILLDGDRILDCNKNATLLLGAKKNELLGYSFLDYSPLEQRDKKKSRQKLNKILKTISENHQSVTIDWTIRKSNNTLIETELNVSYYAHDTNNYSILTLRDISAKKSAEEKLRRSENLFKGFFESNSAIILIVDTADLSIIDANPAAMKFYGWSKHQICTKNAAELSIFPYDRIKNEIDSAIGNYRNYFISKHKTASGEIHDVEIYITKQKNTDDKDIYSFIIHDITERRKAEQSLRESEHLFRQLFEKSGDANLLIRDNIFIDCNDLTLQMLGATTKEEVLLCHPASLSPEYQPDGRLSSEKADEYIKEAFNKGFKRFEWTHKRADGSDLPVEVTMTSIPMKGELLLHTTWRDISQRKKWENEVKEQKEFLRDVIDTNPNLIFVKDYDGKFLLANQAVAEIYGTSVDELIGKSDIDFNPNKEEIEHFLNDDREVITTKKAKLIKEEPVSSPNGKTRWFQTYKKAIKTSSGKDALLGVSTEITERRLAEEALKQSEEQLKIKLDMILNPDVQIGELNITDIVELRSLQQIQDSFAQATGVASVITDVNGMPLTQPSNFSEVCNIIRSTELGKKKCINSDKMLGEISKNQSKPTYQQCLSCGFVDASAPIIVAGKHLGNWLIGQTCIDSVSEEKIRQYACEIGVDENVLAEKFRNMTSMPKDRFESVLKLLWDLAREISVLGYNNLRLGRVVEDLKRTEASLKLANENLEVTLDSIGDAVVVTDSNGLVIRMNPIAELLTGWELKEAEGKHLTEIFKIYNALTGEEAQNPVERVIKYGEIVGLANHTELHSRSGKVYQIADSAAPIKTDDGKIIGIVMVFRDVTEKYLQEQEIRINEEKYRKIFDLSPDAIALIDLDGSIVQANKRVYEWLGLDESQVIGKHFMDIDSISEQSKQQMSQYFTESVKNGTKTPNYEVVLKSSQGELLYGWLMATEIYDDKGKLDKILVMIADLTERKKHEKMQETLYNIAISANNCTDVSDLSREIQKLLGQLVDTTNFFIAFYNHDNDTISLPYYVDEEDPDTTFPAGKTMTSYVIKTGKSLLATDNDIKQLIAEGKVEMFGAPAKVWLGVPLKIGSKVIGAVVIQNYKDSSALNQSHLKMMQYASEQIAIAIERKHLDQMLKESEYKLRSLTDKLPVGIYTIDADGKILYANPALIKMLEYDDFNDIARISTNQTYVNKRDIGKQYKEWLKNKSIVSNEMQLYTKTGRMIWARDTYAITLDESGNIAHLDGAIEDITESKYAEEALLQSEQRLAEAQRLARLGSWSMNLKTFEVFLADETYDLIYKNKSKFIPTIDSVNGLILEDDIEKITIAVKESIDSITPLSEEIRIYRPDFSIAYLHLRGEITCDSFGQPLWLKGTVQDISERKQAEEEIRKLNEILEDKVKERTTQLENTLIELQYENEERKRAQDALFRANEDIARALEKEKELGELKTRFMSMISHEYRTPLTVILNSTYVIEKLYEGYRFKEFQEYLSKIRVSIKGMTGLLEEVLLIGKSEAGKLTYHPSFLNIIILCNGLIDEIRMVDKGQHPIEFYHDVESFETETDEKLLRQIISNLLSNAVKYSPAGKSVILEFDSGIDTFYFKVTDHGIGISPEDQKHLFDPFHRGQNIGSISGTGLGLAIVKRCVTVMNGTIEVESEIGSGTTFRVAIPKRMDINNAQNNFQA